MAAPEGSEGRERLEAILRRRRRARAIRGLALLLALAAGAFFLLRDSETADPPPEPQGPAPLVEEPEAPPPQPSARDDTGAERSESGAAQPSSPTPPEEPLPALEESDPAVREEARALADDPRLDVWLGVEDLVRRFVLAVVNVQEGASPRKPLAHLAPVEPFRVRRDEGRLTPHPSSYARYDDVAAVVAALDARACADLYRRYAPLLEEVYDRLGPPDESLRAALARAAAEILAAPRVVGEPELVFHVNHYRYTDPALEDLSGPQKLLLRTGPENARRIQAKVREVARALGIPEKRLPATPRYRVESP